MRPPVRSRSAHRPAPQRWRRPHRRPAGARWQGLPSWLGRRQAVGASLGGLSGVGKRKGGVLPALALGGWSPALGGRFGMPAARCRQALRRCYRVAMRVLLKWLLSAVALLFVAYVYSGVEVRSFGAALIAAFVIGLFNVVLRPVLVLLTLPVTIVTLGLFLFVINALMFWAAASLLDGFQVTGFAAALLGSLIYSLLGVLIESALGGLFAQQ